MSRGHVTNLQLPLLLFKGSESRKISKTQSRMQSTLLIRGGIKKSFSLMKEEKSC
jgi:hypothetical protein